MRNLRQLFVAFLLLFVATTAMAQSQSDNIDGNTTTAVRADVNGDGVVNEADIAEILTIMKNAGGIAEQPKYYWYAGWTEPTAENIAEIVNETYPSANGSTTMNPAGKTSTTLAGTELDFGANPIYDQEAINNKQKRYYYIVVPTGYGIYLSGLSMFVHNDSGTFNKIGEFTNHTIYKFIQNAAYMINMWKLCEITKY